MGIRFALIALIVGASLSGEMAWAAQPPQEGERQLVLTKEGKVLWRELTPGSPSGESLAVNSPPALGESTMQGEYETPNPPSLGESATEGKILEEGAPPAWEVEWAPIQDGAPGIELERPAPEERLAPEENQPKNEVAAPPEENSKAEAPAEPKPAKKEKKYGWNFGGRFDLEYTSSSTPTYAGISNAPGDAFSDIVMFETDRILPQLELYGEYDGPGFDFYTKIRYKFDKERTELLESYFTLPLAEDEKSNFVVGRFKTQFGIEKLQSSTKALTCNASSVSEAFNLGRAWGGSFEFELDNGVFLALGMMNDPNDHRIMSSDNYLVAHVVAPLGEHSKIGGSALVGQHDIGEGKEIPVQRYGLEYQYKNGKWRVDAEALYSNGYNGVTDNFTRAAGAYVGTAYTILPPLDGVLFVDWFDLDLDRYSSGAYNEEINARTRFVVGLNYYFDRKKVKRLMCNYEWHIPNEGPSISNNGLYVYYSHSF